MGNRGDSGGGRNLDLMLDLSLQQSLKGKKIKS